MRNMTMRVSAFLLAFFMCIHMPVQAVSASYDAGPGSVESVSGNSAEEVSLPAPAEPDMAGSVNRSSVEEIETAGDIAKALPDENTAVGEGAADTGLQETSLSFGGDEETAGDPSASANWGGDMMGLTKAKTNAETYIADGAKIPEIRVAVVDTGVNTAHEVFAGRLTGDVSAIGDDNGHGTAVAGIIAQNTPSNVKILPLKALDENKKGSIENVVEAVNTAVSEGAQIINMSLGISREEADEAEYTQYKALVGEAIRTAKEAGCIIVVSAGNEAGGGKDIASSGEFPACLDNVITVSAINENKERYEFSNFGDAVDFCAPGEDISCASITESAPYQYLSGTSMAAPFISSALAYLKMYNSSLSADELIRLLEGCTDDLGAKGKDPYFGKGLPVFPDGKVAGDENAIETDEKYVKPVIWSASSTGTSITLLIVLPKDEVYDLYRKEKGEEAFAIVAENQIATGTYSFYYTDEMDIEHGKTYEYRVVAKRKVKKSKKNISDTFTKTAKIDVTKLSITHRYEDNAYFSSNHIYMNVGQEIQAHTAYTPQDADTNGIVTWSTSDDSIVKVDTNGLLTAVSKGGPVKLTARLEDAELEETYNIWVSDVDVQAGGKCGEDLFWNITGDNGDTLIISGSGAIEPSRVYPWAEYKNQIKRLILEDGVTKIPDGQWHNGVFSSLINLESVHLGEGLTSIGANAFACCSSLKEISIPQNVTEINDNAFDLCRSLQSIEFQGTLKTVGESVFNNCSSLKKLELPDSVTTLGGPNGRGFMSNVDFEEFRIPAGVTKCYVEANTIGKLIITKNVTSYSESAIVSEYVVEEGNTSYSVIDNVLFNYDATELIKFPQGRGGSYRIPDGVLSIAPGAFKDCVLLTDVTAAEPLKKIGEKAFFGCKELTKITLPDSVETIDEGAFWDCELLTEFIFPASVTVCRRVLDDNVKKVVLPAGIKEMINTFHWCTSLEEVVIPYGLEIIREDCFGYCRNLKKVELPKSVTVFKPSNTNSSTDGFMRDCEQIEEFVIPDCASEIRMRMFANCESLRKVTVPVSVKSIHRTSFENTALTDIVYTAFSKYWANIENDSQEVSDAALHIDVSGTLDNGITWHAEGLSGDLTLTISGKGAMPDFASPSELPWYDGLPEITHVVIGDGITHVGANAFYNAGKLKDAVIGRDVTSFGNNAFRLCGNLDTFIFAAEDGDSYQVEPQFLVSRCTEKNIEPGVHVTKGADVLREGTDYTVGYRDNIKAGTALIVITFTGDHAARGTAFIPFTIASELLEGENIKALSGMRLDGLPFVYTGNEQTPTVTVMSGQWTLREKIDYLLTLSPGRIDRGTYRVVAQGIGAYQGAQAKLYEITACDIAVLGSKARVSPSSFIYDGSEKRPVLSIPGLLAGKDFTVTYSDNTEAGEAAVTASGTGNYKGTLTRSFTIEEAVKEPEAPDPKPDDTNPETGETKPGTDSTDPGTDSTGSGPESSRPGSEGEKPETGGAGSKTEDTKQGTGGGSKKDTSGSQTGSSASNGTSSGTVKAKAASESTGTKGIAGTSDTTVSVTPGTSNAATAADSRSSADQNTAVSKDDSTASVTEGTADSAAGTSADSTAEPAGKDEAEARNTEEAPQGKSSAALTTGAEKNNLDRSLKGTALTLILLTAAVAAYYLILLIKRRKDKEEEEQER